MVQSVLIVDRDNATRHDACAMVESAGYDPRAALNAQDAYRQLDEASPGGIALVVINMAEARHEGIGLLGRLRDSASAPPAIVVLNPAQADLGQLFLRTGAIDFLFHPLEARHMKAVIDNALKISGLEHERKKVGPDREPAIRFDDLVGASEEMRRAVDLCRRAARLKMPVLLEGEPGVGKQMMARAIHNEASSGSQPFVAFDCSRPGSIAAATALFAAGKGRYFSALGGSLFLNEIGELAPDAQEMLVGALIETNKPERASSGRVRLLASSSHDMIALVKSGSFREDLYYRLNVFPIWVPPLRERIADIPALARYFLARFAEQESKPVRDITPEAIALLGEYAWPGNIAELENTILRAVIIAPGEVLGTAEFPQIAAHTLAASRAMPENARTMARMTVGMSATAYSTTRPLAAGMPDEPRPAAGAGMSGPGWYADGGAPGIRALTDRGDVRPLDEIEADVIRLALGRYRGRMTEVARRLGIGRSTLYRKMREFGLGGRAGPGA